MKLQHCTHFAVVYYTLYHFVGEQRDERGEDNRSATPEHKLSIHFCPRVRLMEHSKLMLSNRISQVWVSVELWLFFVILDSRPPAFSVSLNWKFISRK
jgi:hypothetical protein